MKRYKVFIKEEYARNNEVVHVKYGQKVPAIKSSNFPDYDNMTWAMMEKPVYMGTVFAKTEESAIEQVAYYYHLSIEMFEAYPDDPEKDFIDWVLDYKHRNECSYCDYKMRCEQFYSYDICRKGIAAYYRKQEENTK